MKRYSLLYGILCCWMFACISAEDITGPGSIEGKVLNESNEPIANASVRLIGNSINREMLTDSNGIFSFEEVPPGDNYRLIAAHQGYVEDTITTNLLPGIRKSFNSISNAFKLLPLHYRINFHSIEAIEFGFGPFTNIIESRLNGMFLEYLVINNENEKKNINKQILDTKQSQEVKFELFSFFSSQLLGEVKISLDPGQNQIVYDPVRFTRVTQDGGYQLVYFEPGDSRWVVFFEEIPYSN